MKENDMNKKPPYKVIETSCGAFQRSSLEQELNNAASWGYRLMHLFVELHDGTVCITAVMELSVDDENNSVPQRKPRFTFPMVNIKRGETLVLRGYEDKTAVVMDDRNIAFEGEVMSLSKAASKIVGRNVAGTEWWTYNGVTLDKLRRRMDRD